MKFLLTIIFSFLVFSLVSAQIETRKGLYKEHWYSKSKSAKEYFAQMGNFQIWNINRNRFTSEYYDNYLPQDSLKNVFSFQTNMNAQVKLETNYKLSKINLDSFTVYPNILTNYTFSTNGKSLSIHSKLEYLVISNTPNSDGDLMFIKYLYHNEEFREKAYLILLEQHQKSIKELDNTYKTLDTLLQPVAKIYFQKLLSEDSSDYSDSLILKDTVIKGDFINYEITLSHFEQFVKLLSKRNEQLIPYLSFCFIPSYNVILCDINNNYLGTIELVTSGCVGYSFDILDEDGKFHGASFEFNHAFDELYEIIKEYE